ncbi:hypothetical protein BCR33DRAFT_836465 [Rhizoclosmatium globosum]|uniref:Uncharacterized protein n=1 Tax=Rhizoclosmatium globosum TaxID=329046 RepID=A0A1Y2BML7_9FUNG|nr:hypothetical protein BCR33DRAFT_836465 [Rhizoclosmatium globosum]|eukprot:ORY35998.1 hypothetical protein BCR33DRAFT_836465 [Rhizoclosmatium globosum]
MGCWTCQAVPPTVLANNLDLIMLLRGPTLFAQRHLSKRSIQIVSKPIADREANPAVAFLKKRKSYCDALTNGKPAKTGVKPSKTHTAKAGKTVAHPKKTNTAAKVKPSKTGSKGKPTKTATKKTNSTAKPPTKKQYQNLIAKLPICSFGCISKQLGSFDYATVSNSVCKAGFDEMASSCVKVNCKNQNDVKSASNFLMARKGYCFFASVMGKDGKQGGSNATAGITHIGVRA